MRRALVSSAFAAAVALGSVAGAATASAGTGIPLEAFSGDSAPAPKPVQGPGNTQSAIGHGPSGSALTGPVSSGSAEAMGYLFGLVHTFSGGNPCEPFYC